jgi:LacI family transcriptional regulator
MSQDRYRITVLLPVEPEYSHRLLEGAMAYAKEHREVELVEMSYVRNPEGGSPLPGGPLEFDGALVWLNVLDGWFQRLIDEGIVVVNTNSEWPEKKLTAVTFSGMATEKLALDHLAALGRNQAAYIGSATSESPELLRRQNAFLDAAAQRGMDVASFEIGSLDAVDNRLAGVPAAADRRLRGFLAKLPKPAAIWCEDDYVAHLVCEHALLEDLRVPEDLAILGLGDYSVSRLGEPPISTIPQPGQLVGRRGIELIHRILAGKEAPGRKFTVPPPPVVVRESTGSGLSDERFQKIHQRIHDHACEGLTAGDLVKMLPMSQFTFSKHFVRHFGRTPGEEIRRVKAERAKRYLRTTSFSIERIAGLCGFEQQGKFSKFFKRETGMTPSAYRKGGQNEDARAGTES